LSLPLILPFLFRHYFSSHFSLTLLTHAHLVSQIGLLNKIWPAMPSSLLISLSCLVPLWKCVSRPCQVIHACVCAPKSLLSLSLVFFSCTPISSHAAILPNYLVHLCLPISHSILQTPCIWTASRPISPLSQHSHTPHYYSHVCASLLSSCV
jgi:hypothetical protein